MSIPARMTAIAIREPGAPDVLVPQERDTPQPKAGEMLVKVAAAGVNRPDVMQREGKYPPPPGAPDIPGLELAGEVVKLGDGVTRWKVGDKVTALVAGGGYAEYAVVHETISLPVIPQLSMVEAGAIPETFFTVWHNVFERGALKAGETMLLHGGSSGIGTTAIMLAKCHGARVIVTVGSEEKAEACRKLGADVAINYKTRGLRRRDQEGDRRQGCRSHHRHGGGRLHPEELRCRRDGRAHRADRVPASAQGDGRLPAHSDEAPLAHRLGAASAPCAGEGRDRAGGRRERLAADRRRQGQAGDLQDLPAARSGGRACADGDAASTSARSC